MRTGASSAANPTTASSFTLTKCGFRHLPGSHGPSLPVRNGGRVSQGPWLTASRRDGRAARTSDEAWRPHANEVAAQRAHLSLSPAAPDNGTALREEAVAWYAAAGRRPPDRWPNPFAPPGLLPDWSDADRAVLAEVLAGLARESARLALIRRFALCPAPITGDRGCRCLQAQLRRKLLGADAASMPETGGNEARRPANDSLPARAMRYVAAFAVYEMHR